MFKKMKLASKLALVIGVVLTGIFTILIVVTVLMSKFAISNAIYGELDSISSSNGKQVQQIFDAATAAASNIQGFLERAHATAEANPKQKEIPNDIDTRILYRSTICNRTLSPLTYNVERYIMETARGTAVDNPDIAGVGIMFEPNAFQEDIHDYALYVGENDKDKQIEAYGAYDTYANEAFYKEAHDSQKAVVTDPYDFNGLKMVTYAVPIIFNGQIQGVVMADIKVTNFSKVESTNERYKTMYATIYDPDGQVVYDSEDINNTGKTLKDFTPDQNEYTTMQTNMAAGQAFSIETTNANGSKLSRFFSPVKAGSETWWSMTAVATTDVNAAVVTTTIMLLILSIAALLAIILTTIFLLRRMLNPMKDVVKAAEAIASGDLQIQLKSQSQDEIGLLSNVFQSMADNLKAIIADEDYLLDEMGKGNFRVKTKEEQRYVGDYAGLLTAMRKINSNLSRTLAQINQSSDQVSAGSDQVSSGAQALSQGATEQASSVEELAATITEISAQVKDTAHNAAEARDQTNSASSEVAICNDKMREMIEAMSDISNKSNEIGKIIKTIEDIAFQTNILALNAAVEAARAGAAGKGFAVVADEVRNLASKSAEASKNTSVLIEGSIHAVEKGTNIANETAQALMKVVSGTQSVSGTVDKIAQAANEQANSISQVTTGVDQISSVVQTNSATAEESAAASEELSSQAQMLKQLVGQFKLKDDSTNVTKTQAVLSGSQILPAHSISDRFSDTAGY